MCLFSLALDQIKQHIDLQISGLTQELRDLRKTVSENRRSSFMLHSVPTIEDAGVLTTAPTDRQLQTVARRISRLVQHPSRATRNGPISPATDDRFIGHVRLLGTNCVRPADTV